MMKKTLKYIFHSLLGIFAGVVVFEGTLQIFSHTQLGKVLPAIEPQLGQPDPNIGYAFTPNMSALWTRENRAFIQINSLGLRDNEITEEKPAGVFRIALSGDSTLEALQVENDKVFENITEKRLQKEGHNVEIMNFAMAGNGPLRQLTRLEEFATSFFPDLIFMMMSAGDFATGELWDDSQNPAYKIDKNGSITRSYGFRERFSQRHASDIFGQTFLFLIHNSHIFRMFYDKKNAGIWGLLGLPSQTNSSNPPPDACDTETFDTLYKFWVRQEPENEWQVAEHFFEEVFNYSFPQNAVIAMYVPTVGSTCPAQEKKREEIIGVINALADKHGIAFIDWNTEVEGRLPEGYSQSDLRGFGSHVGAGHLNYKGHEVFSQVLYEILMRRGFKP